jgi:hypothetical protein
MADSDQGALAGRAEAVRRLARAGETAVPLAAREDLGRPLRGMQEAAEGGAEQQAPGRSRGGSSTKVRLRVEGRGKPLAVVLTPSQTHEVPVFERLLEGMAVRRSWWGPRRSVPRAIPHRPFQPPGQRPGTHDRPLQEVPRPGDTLR